MYIEKWQILVIVLSIVYFVYRLERLFKACDRLKDKIKELNK